MVDRGGKWQRPSLVCIGVHYREVNMDDWTGEDTNAAIAGCITIGLAVLVQAAVWFVSIWVIVQIVKWAWSN